MANTEQTLQYKIQALVDATGLNAMGSSIDGLKGKLGALSGVFANTSLAQAGMIAGLGGLAVGIAAVVTETVKGIATAQEYQGVIEDIQTATGLSTKGAQELTFTFEQQGKHAESLITGFKKFSKELQVTEKNLREYGVTTRDLDGNMLSADEIFRNFADHLSKMPDGFQKTSEVQNVFGRDSLNMLKVLNLGSEGLDKMSEKAAAFGKVLTDEQLKAIDDNNIAMAEMRLQMEGFETQIGAQVIPVLNEFFKIFTGNEKTLKDFAGLIASISGALISSLGGAIIFITEIFQGLGKAIAGLAMGFTGLFKLIASKGKEGFAELEQGGKGMVDGLTQVYNSANKAGEAIVNMYSKVGAGKDGTFKKATSGSGAGLINELTPDQKAKLKEEEDLRKQTQEYLGQKEYDRVMTIHEQEMRNQELLGEKIQTEILDRLGQSTYDEISKGLGDALTGARAPAKIFADMLASATKDSLKGAIDFTSNLLADALQGAGLGKNAAMALVGGIGSALTQQSSINQTGYGSPQESVQSVQQVRGVVAAPETPMANLNISLSEAMKPTNMLIMQTNGLLSQILGEIQSIRNFSAFASPRG